jgi:hypothetical protein
MPRKLIQDVIVKKKDGKPAVDKYFFLKKKEERTDAAEIKKSIFHTQENFSTYAAPEEKVSRPSRIFLWLIGIALVGVAFYLTSSVFASATITITPKSQATHLADTYTISSKKDAPGLHFQVMTIEKSQSEPLQSDGTENVERKATGKVIVYNNFSSSVQRLITNTRLQTSSGLIYRIKQSIDIPGVKTINGKATPGSVAVDVVADEAGDKYNMKVSDLKGDFTIPGFAGTTKFSAFYARLSSDITGGYIGSVETVSDAKLSAARSDLVQGLKTELIKEMYAQKPDNFVIFDNDYYVETNDLPDTSTQSSYSIAEDESIHAILFDKKELASFLANDTINNFDNANVDLLPNDNFKADISGATLKPWNEQTLKVAFSGDASIVWSYDPKQIVGEIAGESKSILQSIISENQQSIIDMAAKISPPWQSTFPKNPDKITIIDSVRAAFGQ